MVGILFSFVTHSFFTLLFVMFCLKPGHADQLRKPAWFFVHTGDSAIFSVDNTLVMPVNRDIFGFTTHLYYRSHAYMSAEEFTSLWLEDADRFYSFKAKSPWAVLSWNIGEDTASIEFKIKTAVADTVGGHISYGVDYSGTLPYLPPQSSYILFVEANCEPAGLYKYFNKPDCDCTENCTEICRVMCLN